MRLCVFKAQSHTEWARDIRTVQFFQWLSLSNIAAEFTKVTFAHEMILNDALLATVETIIETSKASVYYRYTVYLCRATGKQLVPELVFLFTHLLTNHVPAFIELRIFYYILLYFSLIHLVPC